MSYEHPLYSAPEKGALPDEPLRTELRAELDARFVQNRDAIQNAQSDNAFLINDILGCGRIMRGDSATTPPEAGTGLTLHLPGGYAGIVAGGPFVAADPDDSGSFDILTGVPASGANYGYLGYDGDGNISVVEWSATPLPARVAAGFPCIGLVTASAIDVTSIDLNYESKVYPISTLLSRIETLETLYSTGGSGSASGSGGGGAVAASQLPFQLPGSGNDTRMTDVVVLAIRDELKAYIDQQIASGGLPVQEQTPLDQLYQYVDGLARNVADVKPNSLRRMVLTLNRPGVWGNGENDGPVTDLGGTLPAVPEDREYNPGG